MRNFVLILILLLSMQSVSNAQEKGNLPLTDTEWLLTNLNEKVINKNEEGLSSFDNIGCYNNHW